MRVSVRVGVHFKVLGRFEVIRDGRPVAIRGVKPRTLLAVLLLNANQAVSVERLVEALWPDLQPDAARQTVHYFVHQLRRALGVVGTDTVLVTGPGGYLLHVDPADVDAARFEELLRSARATLAAGDLAGAVERFEAADALWRGPALADFATTPFAQPEAARLEELRLSATEERMGAAVELGRGAGHIEQLEALVRAFPLRERLRILLIAALHRAGRHAAAAEAYEATRRWYARELGIEPGQELRLLGQAIRDGAPAAGGLAEAGARAVRRPPGRGSPYDPHGIRPLLDHAARHPSGRRLAAREDSADGHAALGPPTPSPVAGRGAAAEDRSERRLVTVLVVGVSEPAVEDVDPEDVGARRSATLAEVHRTIERYGGVLHTVIGGTALAVFGIAKAHEDDPERAVRAALALCDLAGGAGYDLRVGIDTGEAVVSSHVGAPGELPWSGGDLTPGISGGAVDTAAALQFAAPAGGVLVSAATHRATERVIDHEPVPHASCAWRPVAPRSRIGVAVQAPADGPETPLIERAAELALLGSLLSRVRAELEPQLVTLIGAPGIGKTRLVGELGRMVEDDPELISWRQGRSLAYGEGGQGMTFWALAEVVKAHAGILDTDDAATAEAKLQLAVADALGEASDAGLVEAHLRPLVQSVPGEAGKAQEEAVAARARFLEALAARRPLVVVFEDLQWADDRLLDFIEELPDRVGPVPLLVVGTARPELLERRRGWGGGKRNVITVSLTPLSEQGSMTLLGRLLGHCPSELPEELVRQLLAKAGGNPLYLEEYVRMLRDLGLNGPPAELPMPETVQQLITARIDTLLPGDRRLLTDLAVIGEQGWVGLLAALGGLDRAEVRAGLGRLERRELLRRTRSASVAGEEEYVFRHALVRDVAYGLLLRAERAAKHQRVAEWLSTLSPDRAGDRAELLANHLRLAVELTRAADQPVGDLAARACGALWSAGDRAYELGVLGVAAGHYAEALRLCPDHDPRRPELLFRLGRARYVGESGGQDELRAALDGFRAAGDGERAARVEVMLGLHAIARGRAVDAHAHVARALDHLRGDAEEPTRSKVMALNTRSFLRLAKKPDAAAFAAAREGLAAARALGQPDLVAGALCSIGASKVMVGDLGGIEDLESGIAMLERERKLTDAAQWWSVLASALWGAGRLERCAEVVAEGRRRTAGWDLATMLPRFDSVKATLDLGAGRWDEVLAFAEEFMGRWTSCDTQRVVQPRVRLVRSLVHLARGRLDAALDDSTAAVDLAREFGVPMLTQLCLAAHGRGLLAAGRRGEAADALAEILAGQARHPTTSFAGSHQVILADDLGEQVPAGAVDALPPTPWRDAAAAYLGGDLLRAAELYDAMGAAMAGAGARVRAARRLAAAGEAAAAADVLGPAVEFLRRIGATAWLRDAETATKSSANRSL